MLRFAVIREKLFVDNKYNNELLSTIHRTLINQQEENNREKQMKTLNASLARKGLRGEWLGTEAKHLTVTLTHRTQGRCCVDYNCTDTQQRPCFVSPGNCSEAMGCTIRKALIVLLTRKRK